MNAAFTALRQVAVSQFLINRFLGNFGWSREEYHGFDQLEPRLKPEPASGSLIEFVNKVPEDSLVGVSIGSSLQMDQFIKTGRLEMSPDAAINGKTVFGSRTYFLCGLSAMERKMSEVAVSCLSSLIAENPLCGSAYLLLGQIYYRLGLGNLALSNMNFAFLHPGDFWLDAGRSALDPVDIGEYKGYEVVFYKSEFHAVPKAGDFFFRSVEGHNALYHNCVASRVRRTLLRMLPKSLISMLRQIVHSTPLRLVILRPVSLSGFLHGRDLMTVITAIEKNQADTRMNPKPVL